MCSNFLLLLPLLLTLNPIQKLYSTQWFLDHGGRWIASTDQVLTIEHLLMCFFNEMMLHYTNAPQYRTHPLQDIFVIVVPQTHKIGFQLRESREFLCQHSRTQDLDGYTKGYTNRRTYALPYEVESNIQNSGGVNARCLEISSCKVSGKVIFT
jgi:hypothetical protein